MITEIQFSEYGENIGIMSCLLFSSSMDVSLKLLDPLVKQVLTEEEESRTLAIATVD